MFFYGLGQLYDFGWIEEIQISCKDFQRRLQFSVATTLLVYMCYLICSTGALRRKIKAACVAKIESWLRYLRQLQSSNSISLLMIQNEVDQFWDQSFIDEINELLDYFNVYRGERYSHAAITRGDEDPTYFSS